jgi:hypothetical protein
MVWVFIGLGLILLVVFYNKLTSVKNNSTLRDLETNAEVSTVNNALAEYLNSFNVYVVKLVYLIDGHEDIIRENIYDTGTNEIRLERAEKFYKLTHQNILTQHDMDVTSTGHQFLISLSLIEKRNGIKKVTILKQANNESLKTGH